MTYTPQQAPDTLRDIPQYISRELEAIARELGETQELELRQVNREPRKPRIGMIVYADGTNWDPGSGEGVYVYTSIGWVLVASVTGLNWGDIGGTLADQTDLYASLNRRSMVFDTVADLTAATIANYSSGYAYVRGYYDDADYADGIVKGSAWYYYDSASVEANNGFTVIVDASARRWKLQHNGVVTAGQAGCKVDGAADDLGRWNALLAVVNASSEIKEVRLEMGRMMISDEPDEILTSDVLFTGQGRWKSEMRFLSSATDKAQFFQFGTAATAANDITVRNIYFSHEDNELTLTGTTASIYICNADNLTIEFNLFRDYARWLQIGGLLPDEEARKANINNNRAIPAPKENCNSITVYQSTGVMMSDNIISQSGRRWKLSYDAQISNFVVGETVTGGTSGATGVIVKDVDAGVTGDLWINSLSGIFQDNETITSPSGSAVANIPSGLRTLAYNSRVIYLYSAPGVGTSGIDNFQFSHNEVNWNNADLEHLCEIDFTDKGISNVFITDGNVFDGGAVSTIWLRLDSGAGAQSTKRLHNCIIADNRITANGSGDVATAGVAVKITQDSDNLISGVTISGNNILGRGLLQALRGVGTSNGMVSGVISGNSISNSQNVSNPFHSTGGSVIYTEMGGWTIGNNQVMHQDEDNTYRFEKFLEVGASDAYNITCTGNNATEVTGPRAFDLRDVGVDGIFETVVENNAGHGSAGIRYVQTTNATVTNLARQALSNGRYRVEGTVTGNSTSDYASYKFWAIVSVAAGVATIVNQGVTAEYESNAAWDVTLDTNSNYIRIRVTGAAATNVDWDLADFKYKVIN